MSKRDKQNRFAQDMPENTGIDFQEIPQEDIFEPSPDTAKRPVFSSNTPQTAAVSVNTVNIETDEDGNDADTGFDWSVITNVPREVAGTILTWFSAGCSVSWRGVTPVFAAVLSKNIWSKLASYCVIRWNENEEDMGSIGSSAVSAAKPKDEIKPPTPLSETDRDDLLGSKKSKYGWILRTSAAGIATAVLLTGIYCGYKTFTPVSEPAESVAVTDGADPQPLEEVNGQSVSVDSYNADSTGAASPVALPAPPAADIFVTETVKSETKSVSKDEMKPAMDNVAEFVVKPAAEDDMFAAVSAAPAGNLWDDIAVEQPKAAEPAAKSETEPKTAMKNDTDDTTKAAEKPADRQLAAVQNNPHPTPKPKQEKPVGLKPLAPLQNGGAVAKRSQKQSELTPLMAIKKDSINTVSAQTASTLPALDIEPAAESSVYDKVASNYAGNFAKKPEAPEKTALIAAEKSEGLRPPLAAAPVREITPKIPEGEPILAVKPQMKMAQPVVKPMLAANEVPPVIPQDNVQAGITKNPDNISNISNAVSPADTVLPQPLGTHLKEQVNELRENGAAQPAELTLRFTPKDSPQAAETAKPALRFTPKRSVPSETMSKTATDVSVNTSPEVKPLDIKALAGLLPAADNAVDNVVDNRIAENYLPPLQNAPQGVYANINPAYRSAGNVNTAFVEAAISAKAAASEGGQTFKKRIKELIQRSPETAETYTIEPGDTYLTVSDKYYGTSLLYTALAVHNRKLNIGWQPAEGTVIEVPTAEFLQTQYAEVINRQERRLDTQTAQQGVKYVVQDGDTLLGLAMDKLHNSSRWHEILAMNTGRLSDPRHLEPGMEILIPAESVSQSKTNRR
ncbi:MAG: LysM peptidoglycan-binding domain-containing protein [Planctomycetaceae bacterium]|jgi:hypothetical protein|nr:LysM peptidoglycan-binding domain-containing protein [Planctomycetaceae bacterium]